MSLGQLFKKKAGKQTGKNAAFVVYPIKMIGTVLGNQPENLNLSGHNASEQDHGSSEESWFSNTQDQAWTDDWQSPFAQNNQENTFNAAQHSLSQQQEVQEDLLGLYSPSEANPHSFNSESPTQDAHPAYLESDPALSNDVSPFMSLADTLVEQQPQASEFTSLAMNFEELTIEHFEASASLPEVSLPEADPVNPLVMTNDVDHAITQPLEPEIESKENAIPEEVLGESESLDPFALSFSSSDHREEVTSDSQAALFCPLSANPDEHLSQLFLQEACPANDPFLLSHDQHALPMEDAISPTNAEQHDDFASEAFDSSLKFQVDHGPSQSKRPELLSTLQQQIENLAENPESLQESLISNDFLSVGSDNGIICLD
jgi:hypothetical protein